MRFRAALVGEEDVEELDIRVWASEAGDVLYEAECAEAADPCEASAFCRMRCRHRLSALIDRGSTHPAVGYLVAAERVLARAGRHFPVPLSSPREAVRVLRRAFASEIRETLDRPAASFGRALR
jgi:hypothetical protein